MSKFDRLRVGLLRKAKAGLGDEIHITVAQLANEYGMERRFVEETLVEMHTGSFIRLSACDEYNRVTA